jgi:hypothetical protein
VLLSACASRLHWDRVGGDEQRAVGDWQVAHVLSPLGHGRLAQQFARASLEVVERNGWGGYLRVGLRGHGARVRGGQGAGRARPLGRVARAALAGIDDPDDRAVVEGQLRTVPGV